MTDLDLAAAVQAAITCLRDAPPEEIQMTRAALDELVSLARVSCVAPSRRPVGRVVAARSSQMIPAASIPRIPLPRLSSVHEDRLCQVLSCDVRQGETIDVAFRRVEAEVGALFAELGPLEARALHQRLTTPVENDVLAIRFSRLTFERRARLLAYLADARRRAAQRREAA
jgi:hypothetical protein